MDGYTKALDQLTEREYAILERLSNGLSDQQIAEELFLSLHTVKWYNRQIYSKLGVSSRTQAIVRARESGLLDGVASAPASDNSNTHNLPSQTLPFIGRESELAALDDLLDDPACRLLTLIGPGGIGKTHLAVEAARRLIDEFDDGVYFVSLAPLSSPEAILPTIITAMSLRIQEAADPRIFLTRYLRDRRVLLVLDNFDDLLPGAGLLTDLLQAAPGVNLLATSRERLNLQEETVLRVGGMTLPNGDDALHNAAVQLFAQSAHRVLPAFQLADDLATAVRICQLVEGMPLAILLAAAWVEVLSPAEIAEEITRSLDFLETEMRNMPERHRSIRAVFDSSWTRLKDAERSALARLSIFRGGFTREAAESSAGAGLQTMMALVNKSLVRRDPSGRYNLHELLRQYAAEHLAAETDAARSAHSRYYLDLLAQTPDEADFENIRAAWAWAVQQGDDEALDRALDSLLKFCSRVSRYQDALGMLCDALDRRQGANARFLLRLREYRGRVRVEIGMAEFEGAAADLEYVRTAAQQAGDEAWARELLVTLGQLYRRMERYESGARYLTETLRFSRASSDLRAVADTLYHLGTVHWAEGDNIRGMASHQEAMDICQQIGLRDIVAVQAYHGMGEAQMTAAHPQSALEYFERSMDLAREVGDVSYESENMMMMGWVCLGTLGLGDYPRALAVFERSLVISQHAHLDWHMMCAYIGLGLAQGSVGDYRQAFANIDKGHRMAESVGLARFACLALDALGQHYQDLNLLERAEAVHAQGVELMLQAESTFWLSRLQANRAIDRLRRGDLNVEHDLREALDIALTRRQEQHAARCLEGLAELYLAQRLPEQSLAASSQLLDMAQTCGLREMEAQARRWRGEALLMMNDDAAGEAELEGASQIAHDLGRKRLIWDVHAAWARSAEARGDADAAHHHQTIVREVIARLKSTVPEQLQGCLPG